MLSLFSHLITWVIYTFPFNIGFSIPSIPLYLNRSLRGIPSFNIYLIPFLPAKFMQPHASRSLCSLISFSPQFCHAHHLFLNYPYKGLLHNHPTRTSISSLLILISLGDHYPFQASFGLFLYRNLLPSFNLSAMMPPRPSNLNCYKNLSIWYAIHTTSTSTLRCLLGHLFLYNFQRLLLGSLFPYHFHW